MGISFYAKLTDIQIVEVSSSVEGIDRHSGCRERQSTVIDIGENARQGICQPIDIVRDEILAT